MKIKFNNPYMHKGEKLSVLQRLIVLHSYIYYELDDCCISDREYDKLCKRYIEICNNTPGHIISKTDYYDAMSDFDGTTGFDIWGRLTERQQRIIQSIAVSRNERRNTIR